MQFRDILNFLDTHLNNSTGLDFNRIETIQNSVFLLESQLTTEFPIKEHNHFNGFTQFFNEYLDWLKENLNDNRDFLDLCIKAPEISTKLVNCFLQLVFFQRYYILYLIRSRSFGNYASRQATDSQIKQLRSKYETANNIIFEFISIQQQQQIKQTTVENDNKNVLDFYIKIAGILTAYLEYYETSYNKIIKGENNLLFQEYPLNDEVEKKLSEFGYILFNELISDYKNGSLSFAREAFQQLLQNCEQSGLTDSFSILLVIDNLFIHLHEKNTNGLENYINKYRDDPDNCTKLFLVAQVITLALHYHTIENNNQLSMETIRLYRSFKELISNQQQNNYIANPTQQVIKWIQEYHKKEGYSDDIDKIPQEIKLRRQNTQSRISSNSSSEPQKRSNELSTYANLKIINVFGSLDKLVAGNEIGSSIHHHSNDFINNNRGNIMSPSEIMSSVDTLLNKVGTAVNTAYTAQDNERLDTLLHDLNTEVKSMLDFVHKHTVSNPGAFAEKKYADALNNLTQRLNAIEHGLTIINMSGRGTRWIKAPNEFATLYMNMLSSLRQDHLDFWRLYSQKLCLEGLITEQEIREKESRFHTFDDATLINDMIKILSTMRSENEVATHANDNEEKKESSASSSLDQTNKNTQELEILNRKIQDLQTLLQQNSTLPPPARVIIDGTVNSALAGSTYGNTTIYGTSEDISHYQNNLQNNSNEDFSPDSVKQILDIFNNSTSNLNQTQIHVTRSGEVGSLTGGHGFFDRSIHVTSKETESKSKPKYDDDEIMQYAILCVKKLWQDYFPSEETLEILSETAKIPAKKTWLKSNTKRIIEASGEEASELQNINNLDSVYKALCYLKNSLLPTEAHRNSLTDFYEEQKLQSTSSITNSFSQNP